jgi:hypothetical protein
VFLPHQVMSAGQTGLPEPDYHGRPFILVAIGKDSAHASGALRTTLLSFVAD